MKFCTQCGEELPPQSTVCHKCRKPFEPIPIANIMKKILFSIVGLVGTIVIMQMNWSSSPYVNLNPIAICLAISSEKSSYYLGTPTWLIMIQICALVILVLLLATWLSFVISAIRCRSWKYYKLIARGFKLSIFTTIVSIIAYLVVFAQLPYIEYNTNWFFDALSYLSFAPWLNIIFATIGLILNKTNKY